MRSIVFLMSFGLLQGLVSVVATAQPVLTLSKTIFAPSEKIVVSFSGFPGNSRDWISIAAAGSKEDAYLAWVYTDGKTSGTFTFDGLPYGDYEARGYYNNEGIVRARLPFRVGNADTQVTIRTQQPTYTPNAQIVVDYSGLPGNGRDWISVARAGSKEDEYVHWTYTEGKQSGNFTFNALPEGDYEARAYFNNEGTVRARYPFKVQRAGHAGTGTATGTPQRLCRRELSVFYAGMGGLGSAWGRAATEPPTMNPAAVADMQAVLGNARDALGVVTCVPFQIEKLNLLISRLPGLSNVQAVAEIEALIKDLQGAVARVQLDCGNGTTLSSLYVTAVHIGAAQAWTSSRICMPVPMPAPVQTVVQNHLLTAQQAFAGFLPCVPGFPLNQFLSIPLNSMNSAEPHTHVVGLHTNLLWNIALSDCCCNCR